MDWTIGLPELFTKYLVSRVQRVFLSEHSIRSACYRASVAMFSALLEEEIRRRLQGGTYPVCPSVTYKQGPVKTQDFAPRSEHAGSPSLLLAAVINATTKSNMGRKWFV